MRLTLSNEKSKVLRFVFKLMKADLSDKKIKVVVSGEEFKGSAKDFSYDEENLDFLVFCVDGNEVFIPITNDTIGDFNKRMYYFETGPHTTLITKEDDD